MKVKWKYIVSALFVLFLVIVYSFLAPFCKDVVNTVIVIIGSVLIIVTFCYIVIMRTVK